MQVSHSAIQGKLPKLGKDLSNLSVKVKEISDALEVLQQYSYQYNLKLVGYPPVNEFESSEDTAKYSRLGVDGITLNIFCNVSLITLKYVDYV